MTKQEISEIKKLFTPKNCSITRICGCYVDGEKNKKTELKQAFLALPEEEMFKYFEILRKSLSGTIGKNLLNLEFPLKSETEGGTQEFLLRLRDSRLKDDALLEQFYDRIIESYEYVGNYLILLIHDAYDVPGRTRDGIEMEDASDEVYDYILTCICPVDLSKPGLSYNAVENTFQNRIRDWVVATTRTSRTAVPLRALPLDIGATSTLSPTPTPSCLATDFGNATSLLSTGWSPETMRTGSSLRSVDVPTAYPFERLPAAEIETLTDVSTRAPFTPFVARIRSRLKSATVVLSAEPFSETAPLLFVFIVAM